MFQQQFFLCVVISNILCSKIYRADEINLLLLLVLLLRTPKISRIPEISLLNCYQDSGRENITLNELLESYYLYTFCQLGEKI